MVWTPNSQLPGEKSKATPALCASGDLGSLAEGGQVGMQVLEGPEARAADSVTSNCCVVVHHPNGAALIVGCRSPDVHLNHVSAVGDCLPKGGNRVVAGDSSVGAAVTDDPE